MRRIHALPRLAGLLLLVILSGCEAVALTLLSAGVGVATGAAVSYTLSGIAYRTFTAPLPQVEKATVTALNRMGIKLEGKGEMKEGKVIKAAGRDREVEVQLEYVSDKTTRMRTVVDKGTFFFKDRATATEIITQTEKVLNGSQRRISP